MIKQHMVDSSVTENFTSKYFAHYKTKKIGSKMYYGDPFCSDFLYNIEKLSENNWELHLKYINEGGNLLEITKVIRNDDIGKLQEISSQENFDFDQKIKPSLYEKFSFINKEGISLIDYAAFFVSIKCFKYLMLNNCNLYNTSKYAVAGGNLEIIKLCEQKDISFSGAFKTAIKFHKNDIFHYLYENMFNKISDEFVPIKVHKILNRLKFSLNDKILNFLGKLCIKSNNYEILSFLEKEGMKVTAYVINKAAKVGNLFLTKYFFEKYHVPKNILADATQSENIEIINYILKQDGILVNAKSFSSFILIFIYMFLMF